MTTTGTMAHQQTEPMSPAGQLPPCTGFVELFARFTEQENRQLAQLKRFLECFQGDKDFHASVESGRFTQQQLDDLLDIGVRFDVEEVALLWRSPELIHKVMASLPRIDSLNELENETLNELCRFPLLYLWMRFSHERERMMGHHKGRVFDLKSQRKTATAADKFYAWRRRRINATQSELGAFGHILDHPTLALELQVGCTVGCYFCAFDADKLTRVFDYTAADNRDYFRGIAQSLYDAIGAPAGHALLYWATEPHDNPHYLELIKEYERITGSVVCTATARSEETWIRKLSEYYAEGQYPWPRISVLSRKAMRTLHRQFTPDEFHHVPMLMQQKNSGEQRTMVPGGRERMLKKLEEVNDLRTQEEGDEVPLIPQGSIACVSGFLINILEKTIRLISPCYTSRQYPYGYRIFDEARFDTVDDFRDALERMIDRIPSAPYRTMPMRFRDDLKYGDTDDGFELVSPHKVHRFCEDEVWQPLGRLIVEGAFNYEGLCDKLFEDGLNPMKVIASISSLFDQGFLDETDTCDPAHSIR